MTESGAATARQCASALRRLNVTFDSIRCSPLLRARQTAGIIAQTLGLGDRVRTMDELGHEFSSAGLSSQLDNENPDNCILLVGHAPAVEQLAGFWLTGEEDGARLSFPKAGMCQFRFKGVPQRGKARLHRLITPDFWPALAGE